MAEKSRTCPACGGTMLYRLGEFQCQQCPNTVAAAPEEPKGPAGRGPTFTAPPPITGYGSSGYQPGSYGGGPQHSGSAAPKLAENKSQWDPGAQYRNVPPPPPAGSFGIGGTPPEGMYASDPREHGRAQDPLHNEKLLFLGIYVVVQAVMGYTQMDSLHTPGAETLQMMGPVVQVISLLIGAIIVGAVLALALFTDQGWVKWTCLSCNGCGVLSIVFALLFAAQVLAEQGASPLSAMINVALYGWLIALLWRDLQQQSA